MFFLNISLPCGDPINLWRFVLSSEEIIKYLHNCEERNFWGLESDNRKKLNPKKLEKI